MSIFERLQQDMKQAMKARDTERLQTIRMLISSLKNKRIELGREPTDDETLDVLTTEAKRRREAAQAYREGDRPELAEKEEQELEIIETYLPKQLSDDQIGAIVDEAIAQTGASSKKDMGAVMGYVMPKTKLVADGNRVREIVMSKLD